MKHCSKILHTILAMTIILNIELNCLINYLSLIVSAENNCSLLLEAGSDISSQILCWE